MSVSDEVSSEVVMALLEMDSAVNPRDVEEVLALLRSTLRTLSSEERGRRRARLTLGRTPGKSLNATQSAN